MKARITFWMMMAVAIAAVSLIVWHHQEALLTQKAASQNNQTAQKPAAQATPKIAFQPTTAAPEKSKSTVASSVDVIVNPQAGYQARQEEIKALDKLADNDRETLYSFLRQHASQDDQQLGQVLKNGLMNALCQIQPPPAGLRDLLAGIYQDQRQNVVLRDYALQHLSAYYQQMAQARGIDPQVQSDELKQTRQTLWNALSETDSSIAGTALLGLTHLSQQGFDGFDQTKIADKALELAGQNGNELTQISALQVCANLNVHDALATVLGAVQAGQSESVKISAVGALGLLGGKDQIPFLNSVLNGSDERLKLPAQQALNRINQHLKQQAMVTTAAR